MKHTRFFRIFSLVACFLLVATSVFAQPGVNRGGNFPDLSYSVSPSRGLQADITKQMMAMPEFKEFFDALTAKIDAEYVKASSQSTFPAPIADYILDKVRDAKGRTDISSKDVIELFYSEIELVQLEAFVEKLYEEKLASQGTPEPIVLGNNARLTVVTKFSPAELDGIIEFLPPFVTLDLIKAEVNNFLVSFGMMGQPEIKLFIGGQKLEGRSDYATVISLNRELVEQKLAVMQNERFRQFLFGDNAPFQSLRVSRGFFEVGQAEIEKKIADGIANSGDRDMLRILEQVNSFMLTTRDIDGKTATQIRLALTNEDTAEGLLDMANGGKAFLRFMAGSANVDADAKKLLNFVLNTEIVRNGSSLTATINWSNAEFVQLLNDGLKKGVVELNKR